MEDHNGAEPVTALRNIGPAQAADFTRVGIHTADALRALGADAAYRRLLANGKSPHFISYYVLHMALQGRPWNDCKGEEKTELRARFDAIKAEMKGDGSNQHMERVLNAIGVGLRR